MSCTAEEIAEKRRIALERLKNRKLKQNTPCQSTEAVQPLQDKQNNTATSPKSVVSFYGSATNVKTNQLSAYENKIKNSPTNKIANRILSQPYSDRNQSGPNSSTIKTLAPVFSTVVTCSCSLITPRRFQVVTSGFFAKLIDVFKTIPSRAYSTFADHTGHHARIRSKICFLFS